MRYGAIAPSRLAILAHPSAPASPLNAPSIPTRSCRMTTVLLFFILADFRFSSLYFNSSHTLANIKFPIHHLYQLSSVQVKHISSKSLITVIMAPYGTNWAVNMWYSGKAKAAVNADAAKADITKARKSTSSAVSNTAR